MSAPHLLILNIFITIPTVFAEPIIGKYVRDAKNEEFSFIVSICRKRLYTFQPDHFCTGSLISQKHVLTAEHCFEKESVTTMRVRYGSRSLKETIEYEVFSWITYPEWAFVNNRRVKDEDDDIAILILANNIRIPPKFTPAALSFMNSARIPLRTGVFAGWGISNAEKSPDIMKVAVVRVLKKKECTNMLEKLLKIQVSLTGRHICTASSPYALAEDGDSGSPILDNENRIFGVTIAVYSGIEDLNERFNVHMSVDYYKPFIRDVLTGKYDRRARPSLLR